jgi:hypothetical protein
MKWREFLEPAKRGWQREEKARLQRGKKIMPQALALHIINAHDLPQGETTIIEHWCFILFFLISRLVHPFNQIEKNVNKP